MHSVNCSVLLLFELTNSPCKTGDKIIIKSEISNNKAVYIIMVHEEYYIHGSLNYQHF